MTREGRKRRRQTQEHGQAGKRGVSGGTTGKTNTTQCFQWQRYLNPGWQPTTPSSRVRGIFQRRIAVGMRSVTAKRAVRTWNHLPHR